MGLRQPSKTAVFYAQAKTGAQQQKEARDKLKKTTPAGQPVQAIGGSATAGTSMVAATTGAQKTATGQVQTATQSAAKDLTINPQNVGSSTVTTIAGTPTTAPAGGQPTAGQPVTQPAAGTTTPAPATTPVAGIQGPIIDMSQYRVEGKGAGGDVAAVESLGTNITTTIDNLTSDLTKINNALSTADVQDRAKLAEEKTRLEGLLQEYYDKLNKQNLGQIGESSTIGQQMLEREQLLASEGGDVSKLAALFGGRARKYGGLEAQIYGKDLEAITEAARAGLEEKGLAEKQADTALERYGSQLTSSKAEYEKGIKTEQQKLDYLKATPQELAGVSKSEMYKLFGAETAEKLFDFDDKGFVSGTETAKVRDAYAKTIADLGTEKGKIGGEIEAAKGVQEKQFQDAADTIFGKPGEAPSYEGNISYLTRLMDEAKSAKSGMESISSWRRKKGFSAVTSKYDTAIKTADNAIKNINKLVAQAEEARKNKDTNKLIQLKKDISAASKIDGKDIFNYIRKIIDTAQEGYGS